MSTSSNRVLLIFIKNPQKGNVKTRLATDLGDEEALHIYQKLLDYTRRLTLEVTADRILWYSRYIQLNDGWDESSFIKKKQRGETLGQRMKYAFAYVFEEDYKKAVIIGSDCGQLKPGHVEEAYQDLDSNDVVIGPSRDGGYYLLGMNRLLPGLFDEKPWSTDAVLQQTIDDCKEQGYSVHLLDELNDVDTKADWQQVKGQFE